MWIFDDIFKSTIWGGEQIAPYKHIHTDIRQIGESWEISAVPGTVSVVSEGPDKGMTLPELLERDKDKLVGRKNYARFRNRFPLLIKFIDAADNLSVQVHPSDKIARKLGYPNGKTEMWYVVGAKKGAKLGLGFERPIDPIEYEKLVESGKIEDTLRFHYIHEGQIFMIPAGRVHAIGKGCFIAEIQQTSDITYRIYDYRRKGSDGRERQLHTKEAFQTINFNDTGSEPVENTMRLAESRRIITTPYFSTDVIETDKQLEIDLKNLDSFMILVATKGRARIKSIDPTDPENIHLQEIELNAGHTVLIPATTERLIISPEGEFTGLSAYIE